MSRTASKSRGTGKSKTKRKAPARKPAAKSVRKRAVSKPTAATPRFSWGGVFRFGLKWSATFGIWALIAVTLLVGWYATDLPDVDDALAATRRPAVTLVAVDGSEMLTTGDLYGLPVALSDLPPALPQAVLATEDRRFYDHFGLDVIGLARATVANLRAGRVVQGGSTLTQQVAKNLFLTPERTLKRKVQELLLALWLEHKFAKAQILTLYLNRVYLGAGTYGVDAAAHKYFGRSARNLSTYQAAMLAGLLKAPSRYNPLASPERAHGRTVQVLKNMVAAGYLTDSQAKAALKRPGVRVAGRPGNGARYFADWVLEQVGSYVTRGDRDLMVRTTFDPGLQSRAEAAVHEVLAKHGKKGKASQAALVALTPDGAVRAMVGGRDYRTSQFNRATLARRQPGSAFKPFVYLAALEAGYSPDSMTVDAPVRVGDWNPRNFDKRHRGPLSLTEALAASVNTVAVSLSEEVGRGRVLEAARRLGITSDLAARPSLALGAGEVTLLELTAAYAAFPADGIGAWPYAIEEISDRDGRVLYRRTGGGPGRVAEAGHARAMNRMLAAVVREGTGKKAALPGRMTAGKTGTSQDFRDAWFVGYTADLVTGVWMGNDDGASMKKVTGGGLPAEVWKRFMTAAHKGVPARPLSGIGDTPPGGEGGFWRNVQVLLGGQG